MILRFIVIAILLNSGGALFAQCPVGSGGCVRVTVYSGGNVDFIFHSMSDYSNGITYNDWTLIGIGVEDLLPAPDFTGWTLSVSAEDANANDALDGSIPANTIPLSNIQVRATLAAGCASCNFFGSPFVDLVGEPASTIIVDSSTDPNCPCPPGVLTTLTPITDQINISYQAGVLPLGSMLGRPADYYSDDIWIDIDIF